MRADRRVGPEDRERARRAAVRAEAVREGGGGVRAGAAAHRRVRAGGEAAVGVRVPEPRAGVSQAGQAGLGSSHAAPGGDGWRSRGGSTLHGV